MFNVVNNTVVVYTGELSQATQYIIERFGTNLDDAIRLGIRMTYTQQYGAMPSEAITGAMDKLVRC